MRDRVTLRLAGLAVSRILSTLARIVALVILATLNPGPAAARSEVSVLLERLPVSSANWQEEIGADDLGYLATANAGPLTGFRDIAAELDAMSARCRELFPDWSAEDLATWERPAEPPEAIRFGESPLPLQLVKHGLPEDKRLDPGVRRLTLPASMVLEEQPRMVITADGAGRKAAVEVLQLMMLRFLTSMPAGKNGRISSSCTTSAPMQPSSAPCRYRVGTLIGPEPAACTSSSAGSPGVVPSIAR